MKIKKKSQFIVIVNFICIERADGLILYISKLFFIIVITFYHCYLVVQKPKQQFFKIYFAQFLLCQKYYNTNDYQTRVQDFDSSMYNTYFHSNSVVLFVALKTILLFLFLCKMYQFSNYKIIKTFFPNAIFQHFYVLIFSNEPILF